MSNSLLHLPSLVDAWFQEPLTLCDLGSFLLQMLLLGLDLDEFVSSLELGPSLGNDVLRWFEELESGEHLVGVVGLFVEETEQLQGLDELVSSTV